MSRLLLLLLSFIFSFSVFAQSRFTMVQFNKKDVPGVIVEVPFVESIVRDAIDKNFEKLGYKSKKNKDYLMYNGVVLKEFGEEPYDIYVLVDRKSRQEKEVSLVTFLMSKGFENFVGEREENRLLDKTKAYMNGLRDLSAAYDLELQILEQENVIKKAFRKLENLKDDSISLQKKKKKLEDDILQNDQNIKSQNIDHSRQQQILEILKSKRKKEELKEDKIDY